MRSSASHGELMPMTVLSNANETPKTSTTASRARACHHARAVPRKLTVISNAPEPQRRPLFCFRGLDLTGARVRARDERADQGLGRRRDLLDRALERRFVRARGRGD